MIDNTIAKYLVEDDKSEKEKNIRERIKNAKAKIAELKKELSNPNKLKKLVNGINKATGGTSMNYKEKIKDKIETQEIIVSMGEIAINNLRAS